MKIVALSIVGGIVNTSEPVLVSSELLTEFLVLYQQCLADLRCELSIPLSEEKERKKPKAPSELALLQHTAQR
jgi:hypothetical protein